MATLTVFNVAAGYFKFDFYTALGLFAVSLPAAFLIRGGRVTTGAVLLIAAIEVIVIADPYPLLAQPLLVANFLVGDCLGFVVTILLAALFVGRLLVILLSLTAAANIIVVAVLSSNKVIQDSSPIFVAGLLAAGALVVLLHSLFQGALTAARSEERKAAALREQLLHAQKLEALGRFAGAIAHDFNNMLMAIAGKAEIVLLHDALPDRDRTHLGDLKGYTEKSAALVRQLLLFSRKQPQEGSTFDVRVVLKGIEGMLSTLVSRSVQLSVQPGETPATVHLNAGQFEQVVMNLVVNARDAVGDGGQIVIRAGVLDATAPVLVPNPPLKAGPYVTVSIRDTGTGMDQDVMSHLFEPFFTTKPPGTGTGLGLSTVYAIVTQAGGGISVSSEPGTGSEFVVYLPASAS